MSENNVAALMRRDAPVARRRRRRKQTTRHGRGRHRELNKKWYGDGTETPTDEGKLYLDSVRSISRSRGCEAQRVVDNGGVAGGSWPPSVLASRYVLGRSLGQGGMGSVWQAEDLTLRRTVAVKLIQLSAQSDDTARARFTREAQAAAGLLHPNIVTVHDFGVDEGIAYMVMECLPGPDLATLIRARGGLPVGQALDFLEQAAAGLAAAHSHGILHRDVKPANLMLTGAGTLKVVDFGIAAVADHSQNLTATSQLIGTLSYLAPERSMGSSASVQSDLYALGCVAVALLTGKPPFEGSTGQIVLKHLNQAPPQLSAHLPGLPEGLDGLIDDLLAKDPTQRPASAQEVIDRLRRVRMQLAPFARTAEAGLAAPSPVFPAHGRAGDTVRRAPRMPGGVWPSPDGSGGPAGRVEATPGAPGAATLDNDLTFSGDVARRLSTAKQHEDDDTRLRTPQLAMAPQPPAQTTARLSVGPGRTWWLLAAGLTAVLVLISAVLLTRGAPVPEVSAADTPTSTAVDATSSSSRTSSPSSANAPTRSQTRVADGGPSPVPRVVDRFLSAPKAVGIALDGSRGRIYVASFGEGSLIVLSAGSGEFIKKIKAGRGTAGLAFDEVRGVVHLQNVNIPSVATVDVDDLSMRGTVPAGDGRGAIAVDSASNRVFVLNEAKREIQVVDPTASAIVDEIPLNVTPRSLMFDQGTNRLYVVSAEANALLVIDPTSSTVVQRATVGDMPVSVAVDASQDHLLVVNEGSSEVAVLDRESLEELARIPVGAGALGIAVDEVQRLAYVANTKGDSLSVLDLAMGTRRATISGVGDGPEMVAVDQESHRVYVTNWYSGIVAVLE